MILLGRATWGYYVLLMLFSGTQIERGVCLVPAAWPFGALFLRDCARFQNRFLHSAPYVQHPVKVASTCSRSVHNYPRTAAVVYVVVCSGSQGPITHHTCFHAFSHCSLIAAHEFHASCFYDVWDNVMGFKKQQTTGISQQRPFGAVQNASYANWSRR